VLVDHRRTGAAVTDPRHDLFQRSSGRHRHFPLAGVGLRAFRPEDLGVELKLVGRLEFGSGAVAMRYEPRR
jgi:hypothetical protein